MAQGTSTHAWTTDEDTAAALAALGFLVVAHPDDWDEAA